MKKIISYLFFLSITASFVLAEDNIRIGATVPLTGDVATYGNLIKGGIELAVEDLKKEGISGTVFFEDTPLSGAGTISALNNLIEIKKVDGIAGNFSNVAMAAMGPVIQRRKIPTFHTAAADDSILNIGSFVFTTNVRIKDEAEKMAEYLYNERGFKRVSIISIQTNFGQSYRTYFREKFLSLGGVVPADETFEIDASDYKSQVLKIKASNSDAIYAACFGRFLGYALRQSREIRVSAPFFSVYESEDTSVLDSARGAAEGLQYLVTASPKTSEKFKMFRDRFLKTYQIEPGTFASNAYDATMILGKALHACKADPDCTSNKISSMGKYEGASGNFILGKDGAATKDFVLRMVKDNTFVDVSKDEG
jgi:branched-chain amino acid transport system substrate-binding protein